VAMITFRARPIRFLGWYLCFSFFSADIQCRYFCITHTTVERHYSAFFLETT